MRFEIERQAAVLDAGGRVIQETRHFHEDTGTTTSGRSKEEAQDYRYFPEPDLVPVAPPRDWVEQIRAALPEAPAARRARLRAEWDLSETDMTALANAGALDLVAETVAAGASPADARKWWLGELGPAGQRRRHRAGRPRDHARPRSPGSRNWSPRARSTTGWPAHVIDAVLAGEGDPDEVVEARGLAVVSDDSALTQAVDEAIAANPEVAAKIRDGKIAAAGVLVGAVMKATRGQADAARVRELILERLTLPDLRSFARLQPKLRRSDLTRQAERRQAPGPGDSGRRSWRDRSDHNPGTERAGPGASASADRASRTATRAAISSGAASPRTTRSSGRPGG